MIFFYLYPTISFIGLFPHSRIYSYHLHLVVILKLGKPFFISWRKKRLYICIIKIYAIFTSVLQNILPSPSEFTKIRVILNWIHLILIKINIYNAKINTFPLNLSFLHCFYYLFISFLIHDQFSGVNEFH